jgi:hypothetical protein
MLQIMIPVSIPVVPNPDIAGLGVSRMLGTCEDFKTLSLLFSCTFAWFYLGELSAS